MAQEPEAGRNASGVARTGKRKWGYDPAQVDAFLERAHMLYESEGVQLTQHDIQNVSFDLVKGGYVIAQVDAALARLERAVVDKQTTWEISQHGRVAWKAQTEALYRQLDEHARRAAGERFKSGEPKTPSYDRKQVDRIIDQSMAKAASELDIEKISREDAKHLVDLNSTSVANVIFTQRKGKRGYDERQVDYYLSSCVQLLTRLESYARVADFVGEPTETSQQTSASSDAKETQLIAPLFAKPAMTTEHDDETASKPGESFDALNKAEREIFAAPAVSPVSTPEAETSATFPPSVPPVFQPSVTRASVENKAEEDANAEAPVSDMPPSFAPAAPAYKPAEPAADSSLAALAHMAESTDEPSPAETSSAPYVPDLSVPSVPQVNTDALDLSSMTSLLAAQHTPVPPSIDISSASAPSAAPADPAGTATKPEAPTVEDAGKTEEKKDESKVSPLFPGDSHGLNVDIPDLSFPTFDD